MFLLYLFFQLFDIDYLLFKKNKYLGPICLMESAFLYLIFVYL
jgi:hypothetical protein